MKIFNAYSNGFLSAAKSKKMAAIIYVITFILALLLAIPFHSTFAKVAGNSMALKSLIKGFDYTIYSDFLRTAGYAISPFISAVIWFGMLYLLFTIFFAGGVLKILDVENCKFSAGIFFKNCAVFFFRFLRLAVYSIILQIIFAIIIFMPLSSIVTMASKTVQNEAALFYIVFSGIVIYLFLFILLLAIGDYAKIILFKNDSHKSLKSIWASTKFVFSHFFSVYFLYLILLIVPVLLFVIYFYLDSVVGMVSGVTILFMFLIQQMFVWTKTWTKLWFLGGELSFYKLCPNVEIDEKKGKSEQKLSKINDEQGLLEKQIT